jgi:polar amino acid transport system substrate-binding protein
MKRLAALSALLLLGAAAPAAADVMADIKARGTLIVGIKADYKPFGFRDTSGAVVGIEPDLAADIAQRMGVKLEIVPVVSSNRIEFVNQGKIDLVIATMSDKPERRKSVLAIDPQYYSDSVNVMLNKKATLTAWEDLKGKTLCGTSGAFYNKEVEAKYGAAIKAFDGSEKPLFALKQGECIGYLYDQTFVQGKLLDEEWGAGYAMPLPGILETPWIMGVKHGETAFAKFLAETTQDWFKQGTIIAAEKKWGIAPTDYAKRMTEKANGS